MASKDHVLTRLRTSEKRMNENDVPDCNWERNLGRLKMNCMNWYAIRATRLCLQPNLMGNMMDHWSLLQTSRLDCLSAQVRNYRMLNTTECAVQRRKRGLVL